MRVVEAVAFGGPEVLQPGERPDPVPGAGEVVVRIEAANVNPTDLGARSGGVRARMPDLQPPFVLGWDLAGEVAGVGEGVDDYRVGQRVVGMIPWGRIGGRVGAYAEMAAVETAWIAALPDGVEPSVAATLPLNVLTAYQALGMIDPAPGSTLLVTGASGAVGAYAVQLATRAGVRVLAVANDGDEAWVASLGAAEVLSRAVDFASVAPVDAVLDAVPVGPNVVGAVKDGGIAVFTRPPGGDDPGRGVRTKVVLVRSDAEALATFAAELAAGLLQTRIAEILPLAQARLAHERVEAGGLRGKLVLAP
ncbi:MAG TPA: NADP-dependent oxidoreductase [Acidimicrobiales bacterium]|nr:NADP-dependent oxidoreductase [Acidimicrobiales bacterium]